MLRLRASPTANGSIARPVGGCVLWVSARKTLSASLSRRMPLSTPAHKRSLLGSVNATSCHDLTSDLRLRACPSPYFMARRRCLQHQGSSARAVRSTAQPRHAVRLIPTAALQEAASTSGGNGIIQSSETGRSRHLDASGSVSASTPETDGGGGGGGGSGDAGGGNGGGGSSGRGREDGGEDADRGGNPQGWDIRLVVMTAAAVLTVQWTLSRRHATAMAPANAELAAAAQSTRRDMGALRRLQREALEALVEVRARLGALEAGSSGGGGGGPSSDVQLAGLLECCVGVLPALSDSEGSGRAQESAGAGHGASMRLSLRTPLGSGRGVALAQLLVDDGGAGLGARPLLQKVLYTLNLHSDLALALALAGGRGDDVVVTLNPVAGRGLTHLVRLGCCMHQACRGRGVGASWRATRGTTLAAALMHDGLVRTHSTPSTPSTRSTLVQLSVAATPDLSLGLVALQQASNSASDYVGVGASETSGHSVEDNGGGNGSSATHGAPRRGQARTMAAMRGCTRRLLGIDVPEGSCQRSLGITGAYKWEDEVVVAAWLAQPVAGRSGTPKWGLSVSSIPDSSGYGWSLALGRSDGGQGVHPAVAERRGGMRSRRTSWDSARSGEGTFMAPASASQLQLSPPEGSPSALEEHSATAGPTAGVSPSLRLRGESSDASSNRCEGYQGFELAPYIAEASMQFPLGEGVHVSPGLVAVRQDGCLTLSLVARTQWFF